MQAEIENCLAQIESATGQIAGAGILVGDSHVVTCAHVLNQALKRAHTDASQPTERFVVGFPFFDSAEKVTGEVIAWRPIESSGRGDIAILKLNQTPGHLSEPVLIAEAEPDELRQHNFVTYGFPAGEDSGVFAHGHVLAKRADGTLQIEGKTSTGFKIQPGFSGAPVFDSDLGRVVGMVVAAERNPNVRSAFMIPTKLLVDGCEEIKKWTTPPFPRAIQDYMSKILQLYLHFENKAGKYVRLPGKVGDEEIEDVVHRLKTTLFTQPSTFVLVLGDYGSGKTAAVLRLAYELAQEAINNSLRSLIPFYFNLSFAKGRPITEAIPDFIQRYNIEVSRSDLLRMMNHRPNLVFILDGFDEMANRTNWSMVPDIMQTLNDLRVSSGIRTVLTSRTTFFRDKIEEKLIDADERMTISRLGDEEVKDYLRINSEASTSAIKKLFADHPDIRELCRLPIHVFMVAKQFSALSDIRKDDIKAIDLYELFIERNLLVNADAFPDWPPAERRKFLQKLAYRWFRNQLFEILPKDLAELAREEISGVSDERLQQLSMYLLNCSFFIRIENTYRFIHYSFVEFFVAETLVEDLYLGNLEKWRERPLYAEIFDFMSQLIQQKGVSGIQIEKVVESRSDEAQSNFLATMYRKPVPAVKAYFERLLMDAEHDLARCVACQGLGLYDSIEAEYLAQAFSKEKNSIIKSLLRRIAERLAESAKTPELQESYAQACAGPFRLVQEDAQRILKTAEGTHSLLAYRKALMLADKRWTSTIAAMYLLTGVDDKVSFPDIHRVGSQSQLPVIQEVYQEVFSLM